MENNKDYEQFDAQADKFLRNRMTTEEIAAFKKELATDEEKKLRVCIMALMIKSMNKVGQERERQMIDAIKIMDEERFRNVAGLKPRVILFWQRIAKYAMAACIAGLLAFGGFKYYGYQQIVSLGTTEYLSYVSDIDPDGSPHTYRGTAVNAETVSTLTHLFLHVKDGNAIQSTIKKLEPLYEQALNEDSPYNEYVDDIAWNLAIAYLKDGDSTKPIPLLEGMIERNEGYPDITGPAQELIQKIKDL